MGGRVRRSCRSLNAMRSLLVKWDVTKLVLQLRTNLRGKLPDDI